MAINESFQAYKRSDFGGIPYVRGMQTVNLSFRILDITLIHHNVSFAFGNYYSMLTKKNS
jgi:hypothetical protein